ncbi:hypothetical protein XH93_18060 [Bradyrhizobium sp. CCBAU 51753]|nr:hypothetical protein XH93_18060 [Bradyrhizobium sp. CCBAU 51753]
MDLSRVASLKGDVLASRRTAHDAPFKPSMVMIVDRVPSIEMTEDFVPSITWTPDITPSIVIALAASGPTGPDVPQALPQLPPHDRPQADAI